MASLWNVLLGFECFGGSVAEQETHPEQLWIDFICKKKVKLGQVHRVQAISREWGLSSQSVNFLVSCRGAAHECSLQFSFLLFPELCHETKAQLIYLFHSFWRILTAQEFYVPKGLCETNLQYSLGL